jgi:hypothetical protein
VGGIGKGGVLRAYVLIISVGAVLFSLLRATHVSWGFLSALLVLAYIVVLFGGQRLIGPTEHVEISSVAFEHRIRNRYSSEVGQLSDLGFTTLFFYGEAFSLFRVLLIYPAFLFLIMLLNREAATVQNGWKLCFGFPVFISGNRTSYAHPLQLGVKYHTLFQDGTILMTKNFGGKNEYGPKVVAHGMENASIFDAWAEHQKQIQALEAAGKQVNRVISFQTYADISNEA